MSLAKCPADFEPSMLAINAVKSYLLTNSELISKNCGNSAAHTGAWVAEVNRFALGVKDLPQPPSIFEDIVSWLREGFWSQQAAIHAATKLFYDVWPATLPGLDTVMCTEIEDVIVSDNKKVDWDRIVSPRYSFDVQKLTPTVLACLFGLPFSLAREQERKTKIALGKCSDYDKSVYVRQTPIRCWFTAEAYTFSALSYVELCGYVQGYVTKGNDHARS